MCYERQQFHRVAPDAQGYSRGVAIRFVQHKTCTARMFGLYSVLWPNKHRRQKMPYPCVCGRVSESEKATIRYRATCYGAPSAVKLSTQARDVFSVPCAAGVDVGEGRGGKKAEAGGAGVAGVKHRTSNIERRTSNYSVKPFEVGC